MMCALRGSERLKARAERLAADLIHVLYEDEEVGEELADAVLEALIDQAHLALEKTVLLKFC